MSQTILLTHQPVLYPMYVTKNHEYCKRYADQLLKDSK